MILSSINRIVSLMSAEEIEASPILLSGPIESNTNDNEQKQKETINSRYFQNRFLQIGRVIDMNNNDYRHFSIGLRKAIAESEFKSERDFARGLMHNATLSKDLSLNTSTKMTPKNRQKCAERLGVEVEDIVFMGRSAEGELESFAVEWQEEPPFDNDEGSLMTAQEIYFWKLYHMYGTEQMLDDWIMELLTFAPSE